MVHENKKHKNSLHSRVKIFYSFILDKKRKKSVAIDVAILTDGNIRNKEHKKLEKY